jgi:polysaccharide biosynthesis protein PslH
MSEILFLSHRIPYPPDKGDKIRSYHLLRALAERHTVHLGTFIDDPADWQHVGALKRLCGETCIRPLNPRIARLRSTTAFATGTALTMAYYSDRALRRWTQDLNTRRPLAGVFAFSSSMGQYAVKLQLPAGSRRIMDFCDVDSDKWRQYAQSHGVPLKCIFLREARMLAGIEQRYTRMFDTTLVVSEVEALILRETTVAPDVAVQVVPNGVDTDYFDPTQPFSNPFALSVKPIVFTGAMDYYANVDGVDWFARDVFPQIRRRVPEALFVIVGSNPSAEVRALAKMPGVIVTGRVPDTRPYLAHAAVVVAPLRIARGVQNKVLEALAMDRPVVATANAAQGIPAATEAGIRLASDAGAMADEVVGSLQRPDGERCGRRFVQARYGWAAQLANVMCLFNTSPARPGVAALEQDAVA